MAAIADSCGSIGFKVIKKKLLFFLFTCDDNAAIRSERRVKYLICEYDRMNENYKKKILF